MKRMILGAKQVGQVFYMVESLEALYNILQQGQIKVSSKKEKFAGANSPEYFVSLTRDYLALYKQNPDRWHCGLILDGNVLSETYSIDPIHYSGNIVNGIQEDTNSSKFAIKQITTWEDDTYDIQFAGWKGTFSISKSAYDDIVKNIESLDPNILSKCRLQISTGKSKSGIKGCKFIERYIFNNPAGGPPGLIKKVSLSTRQELLRITDQYEERIHGPKTNKNFHNKFKSLVEEDVTVFPYIHVRNAIKGLVFNSKDFTTGSEAKISYNKELSEACENLLNDKYHLSEYVIENI